MPVIRYNKEKLNSVIRDFCIMTNVSVAVTDENFKIIADCSEKSPRFCMEIQKSDEGRAKCECSDISLLKKCRESRTAESHICHAGILDAALPIIKANKIIGYVMIGRTRVSKFDEGKINWLRADNRRIKKLYYDITKYNDKQIKSMFRLAAMIVSFILTNDIITAETDEFSAKVDEFIEQNINSPLTVSGLCKEFNVSKNALYDKFRSAFDSTVNEYIISKRLLKAKELLKTTDYTMSRIAYECGIESYTYFSKIFKKENGIPPNLYRKQYAEKNT